MAVNKVVINTPDSETTLIDLTSDSVTPETLVVGMTAHDASGEIITGAMPPDPTVTSLYSNYSPNGERFSKTIDINWDTEEIEVGVDLSLATQSNQNILSVGLNIDQWGVNNIHMYYNVNAAGRLEMSFVDANNLYARYAADTTKQTMIMVVNKNGIAIDGVNITDLTPTEGTTTYRDNVVAALMASDTVTVGSLEGNVGSTAKYYYIIKRAILIDTKDATATAADILSGKTAYVDGVKVTGNIPSKAAATITPGTSDQSIAAGQYLSGKQTIKGDANLVAENIAEGVSIFGVAGALAAGAQIATGEVTSASVQSRVTVKGLGFKPSRVIITANNPTSSYVLLMALDTSIAGAYFAFGHYSSYYYKAAKSESNADCVVFNDDGFTISGITSSDGQTMYFSTSFNYIAIG